MAPRKKIDQVFKDEKKAVIDIANARSQQNWDALQDALQNAINARLEQVRCARNGKRVLVVDSMETASRFKEGGRFLVRPPLVARDAGLLENGLKAKGIYSLVVCREPKTQLGLCPVVSLGSGVTVRVQIDEPKQEEKPSCAWFDYALEELGSHVLEQMKPELTTIRQLDYLLAHIPSIATYKPAYQRAITLCNAVACENG